MSSSRTTINAVPIMKKLAYLLAAAALVLAACTKESFEHPTEAGIPSASAYTPVVTVDQTTNQVSFSVDEKGIIPVWVLPDKEGKWTEYKTGNPYKRIFASAGDYAVRFHAMNANGISPDYVEKTFHVDNTIMNFDKYIRQISGGSTKVWRFNNDEAAHMACGASVENPTEWWSAQPNEKKDFGVYDNRLSFTSDGNYTFDPGAACTVYVNTGVTASPYGAFKEDSDYRVTVEAQTTSYKFEVEGDALVLKLEDGALFPYIPNNDYVTNSSFYVESIDNNALTLVWYTPTGNGGGSIAWQFILTSKEPGGNGGGGSEDPIVGTWVWDKETAAHFGCGETIENPTGWWSAAPNEKKDFGLYDNKITFTADGKYIFDPGEDGNIYVNIGVTKLDNGGATADFDYPWQRQETTYDFDGETLTLPAGTMIGYVPNDDYFDNPSFTVRTLTETTLELVWFTPTGNGGGSIAWLMRFVKEGGSQGGGEQGGGESGSYTYGDNLLGGLYLKETWFSAAGWGGGLDPQLTFENGKVTLTVPEVGGEEWMGQVKLVADIPADPEKRYAFFAKIESSSDGTCTVKVADAAADAEHAFFYDNNVKLTAYDALSYKNEPISPDQAYNAVMVIFDFGRMAPGTEITITGMALKEITGEASGGSGEQGGGDYGDSILDGLYFKEHWFSAAGWGGGLDPQLSFTNGVVTLTVPGVGGQEWMGQVKLVADVPASPETAYCFKCKVEASTDGTCTIKVADAAADAEHAFFYDNNVSLAAYDVLSYVKEPVSPDQAYEAVMVIFDFGRMAPGTEITIRDITLSPQK